MGIETRVYDALTTSTALAALVSTRIYPIRMMQGVGFPTVVYRRASGDRHYDMSGYSTLENAIIELAVYATAVTARRLASDAAISAISSATAFTGLAIAAAEDSYNDATELYVRTNEISIWNNQ